MTNAAREPSLYVVSVELSRAFAQVLSVNTECVESVVIILCSENISVD